MGASCRNESLWQARLNDLSEAKALSVKIIGETFTESIFHILSLLATFFEAPHGTSGTHRLASYSGIVTAPDRRGLRRRTPYEGATPPRARNTAPARYFRYEAQFGPKLQKNTERNTDFHNAYKLPNIT